MEDLIKLSSDIKARPYQSTWIAPSNIAFVKYWGKRDNQIPANPSLSMTLSECYTRTDTHFSLADKLSVELWLDGVFRSDFSKKILSFLEGLKNNYPFLANLHINIKTNNTFPHGSGIASSASGLAAFALTLNDYFYFLQGLQISPDFFKGASTLARLGSGSACRSLFGGFTIWGKTDLISSSDFYANSIKVHSTLNTLHDAILVISSEEKIVSSRAGHSQMAEHFFALRRYEQARSNFQKCLNALQVGDFLALGEILESEALSLHAMMMTSPQPYFLLKPNTLKAIEMIGEFRRDTKIPLYFTLDAGPNLHLIYMNSDKKQVETFINSELKHLAEMVIFDRTGEGPHKC